MIKIMIINMMTTAMTTNTISIIRKETTITWNNKIMDTAKFQMESNLKFFLIMLFLPKLIKT